MNATTTAAETMTCPRCGGSGNVERFSNVYRGVCFKCGGSGRVKAPKRARRAGKPAVAAPTPYSQINAMGAATPEQAAAIRENEFLSRFPQLAETYFGKSSACKLVRDCIRNGMGSLRSHVRSLCDLATADGSPRPFEGSPTFKG